MSTRTSTYTFRSVLFLLIGLLTNYPSAWSQSLSGPLSAEEARSVAGQEAYTFRTGEIYAAAYGGGTIGHGVEVEGTGLGAVGRVGTIGMSTSGVYGGKVGYFFPGRATWLGVEAEALHTTPHLKETTIRPAVPIQGIGLRLPGAHLAVTTVAFNVLARAPFLCEAEQSNRPRRERPARCALQPYAGVGIGIFYADVSNRFGDIQSPVVGLNALAGLRYYVSSRVALFGEYKYNRASFDIDNIEGTGAGIRGVYSVSHIVGGLSLHW